MKRAKIVGLTGGIATGKSTVAKQFQALGAQIIDADVASRTVVTPGSEGLNEIVKAFGEDILHGDGTLDRKKLGRLIFADTKARRLLESITHPLILKHMRDQLETVQLKGQSPVIILDVPLLFETGLFLDEIDETVLVYARPDIQLKRLLARDMLNLAEAKERIEAQLPIDEKVGRSTWVIDNSGSPEKTYEQVNSLWKEWIEK